MKSIKIFATVGAIALLGLAGLSSCKTNNAPEIEKGADKYNGETVKTRLLISITGKAADNNNNIYRMPATKVQDGGVFLGMDSIRLLPFADAALATRTGKTDIKLTPIANDGLTTTGNAKVYHNVQIPLGTKYFLFYGKAIDSTKVLTSDVGRHRHGIVTAPGLYDVENNNKAKSAINFNLVPLYTGSAPAQATALATYMTTIATSADGSGNKWEDHANLGIKALYTDFTTKMKAGSSHSVLSAVNDLYNSMKRYKAEQDGSDLVVDKVIENILTATTPKAGPVGAFADTLSWTVPATYANYPDNINLPEGAAVVTWSAGAFTATGDPNIGNLTTAAWNKFVYPPSLWYYTASGILTSESSEEEHYVNGASWMTIKSNYTAGDSVVTSTASVAIKDSINYGVGQLKSSVLLASNDLVDGKNITRTGVKIGWKGILIGGQKRVDYKFERDDSSGDIFTIYDNMLDINGTNDTVNKVLSLTTSESYPNYTLVFSSKDNSSNDDKIYVALELVNNGEPFFGYERQLIPRGGTFYLVGCLQHDGSTVHTNMPANHNIFFKDYQTAVKFTIGSLANAYYTIPDLRTEGLELGLSVDLDWATGYSFDITL